MELLLIIVLVVGVVYFAKRKPVYNLAKFEKTFDGAIGRFGETNGEFVIAGVKMACDALDAKFTALDEANAAISTTSNSANVDEVTADETVKAAEEEAAELERKAREERENAANAAKELKASATRKRSRIEKLSKMKKHM